ncbi:MAG: ParM/StbA family protein [Gammaproteobacteria bacterium]|nr:ParM/StbA family protein [Gammaproteobacteria bacterium]
MTQPKSTNPVPVGLDDGYAYTKLVLPNGQMFAIPSRARLGKANVTWIDSAKQRIFEYETEAQIFAVGEVEGEPTEFDAYPFSGLNRAIVQHGLQQAGLEGHSVHAVSGLPVGSFYLKDGSRREETLARKRASLKQLVQPLDGCLPAGIAFHEVIPEALAAWYDYVITESDEGVLLEPERLQAPLAVVDIGGRTTDYVVVADQAVVHASSGSLRCGLLDVKRDVSEGIRARFDLEVVSERTVGESIQSGTVRLFGKNHDVKDLVQRAQRQMVERLHSETQRQLGRGAELERILFVGGGTIALATHIRDWFPNQVIAEHPAFANARGMLKYLRYVCEASNAA